MTPSPDTALPKKPKLWLGLAVGWLALLGLKWFVPIVVLTGISAISHQTGHATPWFQDAEDGSHPVWYALQAAIFFSACCSGALGAWVSAGRYRALAIGLSMLSLLSTFFKQFPLQASATAIWIWAGGPCLGACAGVAFIQFCRRWRKRSA